MPSNESSAAQRPYNGPRHTILGWCAKGGSFTPTTPNVAVISNG